VTPETRNLITALHNILSKLELMTAPGCDEEAFVELKHVLNQRIEYLRTENCPSIPTNPLPVKTISSAD
jgi:hypothetical protein